MINEKQKNQILLYRSGELPEPECSRLEVPLAREAACCEYVADLDRLESACERLPVYRPSRDLAAAAIDVEEASRCKVAQPPHQFWIQVAAAAALVTLGTVIAALVFEPPNHAISAPLKPSAVATEPIEREGHGTITAVAQARVDAVFGSRKLSIARRLAALHAVAKDLDARIERRVNRRYEKWEQ